MSSVEMIAKILSADQDFIKKIEDRFSFVTGKKGVMDRIETENGASVDERLEKLGLSRNTSAKDVYNAFIEKIANDDALLVRALGTPNPANMKDCNRVIHIAQKVVGEHKGFFMKKDVAASLLKKEPPRRVMKFLGYDSVETMLAQEDLLEVFSALRFVEGNEWLNGVFFKHYDRLTPSDFEERLVVAHTLSSKWNDIAGTFVAKKWHNISHLKELGVVFVIPISLGFQGEILRMLSLVLHYLHEVPFYSDVIRKISDIEATFAINLVSLLRGDVVDRRLSESEKSLWLVIQRYLAKDDLNEWRLFVPHINPEALHWLKAEEDLIRVGDMFDGLGKEFTFWHDLDWVGEYFKDDAGNETLVSFDLVDNVMALVMQKNMIKYLYHHQEALWNKIFIEYFGRNELEKFSKEYLLQGYFEI